MYMESRKMVLMNLFAGQQWRCTHRGQSYGHGEQGGRRGWDRGREYHGGIYIIICKWKLALWLWELKQRLHNNIDGEEWVGGGREFQEAGVICTLIHVDVWQTWNQYCKAIILQLKIKFKKEVSGKQPVIGKKGVSVWTAPSADSGSTQPSFCLGLPGQERSFPLRNSWTFQTRAKLWAYENHWFSTEAVFLKHCLLLAVVALPLYYFFFVFKQVILEGHRCFPNVLIFKVDWLSVTCQALYVLLWSSIWLWCVSSPLKNLTANMYFFTFLIFSFF